MRFGVQGLSCSFLLAGCVDVQRYYPNSGESTGKGIDVTWKLGILA